MQKINKSIWVKETEKFVSFYERDKKGERVFILKPLLKKRRITFESWQMAKQLGYIHLGRYKIEL